MPTNLVGPDGREYFIENDDPAALAKAQELGYRPLGEGEERTTGEALKGGLSEAGDTAGALLEGAAQGLTAGGYGAMLGSGAVDTGAGQTARRELEAAEYKERQAAHPLASLAGNIAGAVVSPLSKVGGAVADGAGATSALGRIGASALGGMAEGTLFGAGNAVSDAELGDHNLTAENLIAGAGLGAVLGGAGGGIATALREGASAVASATKKGLGKLDLGEFSKSRLFKAVSATKDEVGKIPEAERDAVASALRKHVLPEGQALPRSLDDALASVRAEREALAAPGFRDPTTTYSGQPRAPSAEESALAHAENLLGAGTSRRAAERAQDAEHFKTALVAGVASGGKGLVGIPAIYGRRLLRENGDALISKLTDTLSKSPAMSTLAASFARRAEEVARALGHSPAPLAAAAAQSPQRALATHLVMAQADPHYGDTAALAGFIPQSPGEQSAAVARAHGIATIAASAAAQGEELERHIDKVFKGGASSKDAGAVLGRQDFGAKRMRTQGDAALDKRATEIQALATNPDALLDRLNANVGEMHNVAPGVAASLTQTANRAVQYLSQAAQRPLKAGPLANDWKMSAAERHSFTRKLEVVEEPMVVLKHAAAGTLTKEQVEALNAVYPALGRQIADKMLERMADSPKGVPYGQKLMLSLLTKVDVDGTLSPQAIARNQAAIQRTKGPKAEAGAAAAPQAAAEKGAEKLDVAGRMATSSQAREVRE